eukprot:CAMPEP_0177629640 /NCGR_PEP_ID=MMETSP0447-20121125/777_1 /TAXON_ID=0 /ORGANISM="Stygamoeba regulata, Strain BSH-02190019" /LENGTH=147 /DNA_ID=CAMNT_0019130977 /DNA_START=405 /DNA_END=844 /DNA_ORIENTATION=+
MRKVLLQASEIVHVRALRLLEDQIADAYSLSFLRHDMFKGNVVMFHIGHRSSRLSQLFFPPENEGTKNVLVKAIGTTESVGGVHFTLKLADFLWEKVQALPNVRPKEKLWWAVWAQAEKAKHVLSASSAAMITIEDATEDGSDFSLS